MKFLPLKRGDVDRQRGRAMGNNSDSHKISSESFVWFYIKYACTSFFKLKNKRAAPQCGKRLFFLLALGETGRGLTCYTV